MSECVYYTCYGNEKYKDLLEISLISLNMFFDKEHIYIFTNLELNGLEKYCNIVSHTFPTGFAKPMAERYNIIEILSKKYERILHIDCDTICINKIDKIFQNLKNDKISFATENTASSGNSILECWAGPLLSKEEKKKYAGIDSICAGVFACTHTFSDYGVEIAKYICALEESGFRGSCGDQHGLNKFVLDNEIYDFSLQKYVYHDGIGLFKRNEQNKIFETDTCIVHFAGGVQPSEIKRKNMNVLLGECCDRNDRK